MDEQWQNIVVKNLTDIRSYLWLITILLGVVMGVLIGIGAELIH